MHRKKLVIFIIFLIVYMQIDTSLVWSFAFYFGDVGPPKENEVHIGQTAVVMPLGKIMLIKKSQNYCAVKFTKFWSKNMSSEPSVFVATGSDEYATYESYYKDDKDFNLLDKSWKIKTARLCLPKLRGIGRLAFSFADDDIYCGNIIVNWAGRGAICFNKACRNRGDDGFEFAPTPWTDISQVNFYDSRIKWYKFDLKRVRENISIYKIWENLTKEHPNK